MFDYHMHSRVSFDGHDTGAALVQAGTGAGLGDSCANVGAASHSAAAQSRATRWGRSVSSVRLGGGGIQGVGVDVVGHAHSIQQEGAHRL